MDRLQKELTSKTYKSVFSPQHNNNDSSIHDQTKSHSKKPYFKGSDTKTGILLFSTLICLYLIFTLPPYSLKFLLVISIFIIQIALIFPSKVDLGKHIWSISLETISNCLKKTISSDSKKKKEKYNDDKVDKMFANIMSQSQCKSHRHFDEPTNRVSSIKRQTPYFSEQKPQRFDFHSSVNFNPSTTDGLNINKKIKALIEKIYTSDYPERLTCLDDYLKFDEEEFKKKLQSIDLNPTLLRNFSNSLKSYIISKLLPKLIDYHYNNLNTLNKDLFSLNIKIETSIESISKSESLKNHLNFRINNYTNSTKKSNYEEISIFWADNKLISHLIEIVSVKISTLNNLKHNINFKDIDQHSHNHSHSHSNFVNIKDKLFNNSQSDMSNLLINSEFSSYAYKNEATLTYLESLKKELEIRIKINESLTLDTTHIVNSEEEHLITLDYISQRLEGLYKSSLNSYDNSSGGNYYTYTWNSFFPTDACIITELIMKNIHNALIRSSNITKTYLIAYPSKPILDSKANPDSLFMYKINSSRFETHFDVVNCDKIIKTPSVSICIFIK